MSSCLFYFRFNFDLGIFHANQTTKTQNYGRGLVDRKLVEAPPHPLVVLRSQGRLSVFGSLLFLDVLCGYVLLFLLDTKIESR